MGDKNKLFGQRIVNNILVLFADEKFRKKVLVIRKKFEIPEKGIDEQYFKKFGQDKLGSCAEVVEALRVKYKLNEYYGAFLTYMVIFNKMPDLSMVKTPKSIKLYTFKERSGLNCVYLKIYPETTLRDIQSSWKQLRTYRKQVYGYEVLSEQPLKNAERDMYLRAGKRMGIKNKNLSNIINQLYPQSGTTSYDNISKIINKNKALARKILHKNN